MAETANILINTENLLPYMAMGIGSLSGGVIVGQKFSYYVNPQVDTIPPPLKVKSAIDYFSVPI